MAQPLLPPHPPLLMALPLVEELFFAASLMKYIKDIKDKHVKTGV